MCVSMSLAASVVLILDHSPLMLFIDLSPLCLPVAHGSDVFVVLFHFTIFLFGFCGLAAYGWAYSCD